MCGDTVSPLQIACHRYRATSFAAGARVSRELLSKRRIADEVSVLEARRSRDLPSLPLRASIPVPLRSKAEAAAAATETLSESGTQLGIRPHEGKFLLRTVGVNAEVPIT